MVTTLSSAIEVRGLTKRFGDVTALDGLDLDVAPGAFFGLLGPNGAGKTTAVSILATLAAPDAGTARILGHDVATERAAVRRLLGIVFQESTLDRDLTAREHLELQGRLYHLADRDRRVRETLAQVGLEASADRPVRGFSGGMRRRLEIGRGLMHRPRVLFLDEPTLGLDVHARAAVWDQLRRLHEDGETTIFLTTHSMEEADSLCEQVAIVDRGRIVEQGSPAELKGALGGDVAVIGVERVEGAAAALEHLEGVRDIAWRRAPEGAAGSLRVTVVEGSRRLPGLLTALHPFGVVDVTLHRPSLAHVFLHCTGHPFEVGPLGAGDSEWSAVG